MNQRLTTFVEQTGAELTAQFARASTLGEGTSQEVADFREGALRDLMRRFYPAPHTVTKGKILGPDGSLSASIDCVVLSHEHPHLVDSEQKLSFLLADGVDLVVELKPDLTDSREIARAIRQVSSVKEIVKRNSGLVGGIQARRAHPDAFEAWENEAHRIPTVVFANSSRPIEDLVAVTTAIHQELDLGAPLQFDIIAINGYGLLTNKKTRFTPPILDGRHAEIDGLFWEEFGNLTLPALLFRLAEFPAAVPRMSTPVFSRYLDHVRPSRVALYSRDGRPMDLP